MTLYKRIPRDYRGNEDRFQYVPANLDDVLTEALALMADTSPTNVRAILATIQAADTAQRIAGTLS